MTICNVKDFPSVQDAVNAISGDGTLYFPGEVHNIPAPVVISNKNIAILGEDRYGTVLNWNGATGGFVYVGGTHADYAGKAISMSRLTMKRPGSAGASIKGLKANWVGGTGQVKSSYDFSNITLQGNLDYGFDLFNAKCGVADNIDFAGQNVFPYTSNGFIRLDTDADCVEHFITRCRAYFTKDAVKVQSASPNGIEGVYISTCAFVAVNKGVYWNTATPQSLFTITGSHISAQNYGIYSEGCNQFFASGNLIFKRQEAAAGAFAGIQIKNGGTGQLSGNTIELYNGAGIGNNNGIILDSGTSLIQINQNILKDCQTGIWATAGSSNSRILDNMTLNVVTPVLNQGTNNIVRL